VPYPPRRPLLARGREVEPGAIPVPGPARRCWSCSFPVARGLGPGAAVPDGVPLAVGDGHAPGGLGVAGGGGQVTGQGRVSQSRSNTPMG
jgi:hypothetical protein